jgi:hypothetical protein
MVIHLGVGIEALIQIREDGGDLAGPCDGHGACLSRWGPAAMDACPDEK